VYQNGVLLVNGTDVTVTSGTVVVLAVGATAGDIIQVLGNQTFNYAATVPASKGGTGLTSAGAAGNVLTSDGTNWTSAAAAPGVPTGMVITGPYYQTTTTAASGTGSVATITFTPAYTMPVGSTVTIAGVTPSGYNGVYTVTASSSGSVSFASSTTGSQTVAGTATMTPQGFLLCDGSLYTRTSYPTLAALVGTPILASSATNSYTFASAPANSGFCGVNNVLFSTGTLSNVSRNAAAANALFTSTDGITWTSRTANNISGYQYEDEVAYNGTTYVASCQADGGGIPNQSAFVQYTTNLSSWSKVSVIASNYACGTNYMAWGAGIFVTNWYGSDGCNNSSGCVYSTTGTSGWTSFNLAAGLNGFDSGAGYASGLVLIRANRVFYSSSGASFTEITSNFTQGSPVRISYTNGIFVLGTSTGYIYTSTTGAGGSWTLQNTSTTTAPSNSYYNKWRWNGTAYVSANGWYTTDWKVYANTSVTAAYGALAIANGNKLYSRIGTQTGVYWWDFNSYTQATQFPVPNYTNINQNTTLLNSPYYSNRFYIKT
jgi:hypothetical protein